MKRELKRPKIVLGLLVALALALSLVMAVPVTAQVSFTGDVEWDFTGPNVLIFTDPGEPGPPPIPDPELDPPATGMGSGWDIKDVRITYNPATDILYVGVNSHYMVGDADNDGGEATKSWGGGVDNPNLGGSECVSVYFDLNQDATYDVIAGVAANVDFSGFSVNVWAGSKLVYGAQLVTHIGTVFWDPTLTTGTGDFEFTILDFSLLPGQGGELGAFDIAAYMGSQDDGLVGEDDLVGSTSPAINILKMTNGTDNNSPTGPAVEVGSTVTWTYNVTNPGTVPLSNITVTDSEAGVTPGYVTGDTANPGFLDPTENWLYQATGTATVGQYSNTGTATGNSDGFTVSATDPDHYIGVDVRISISPLTDDNEVGTNHVLTIFLERSVAAGVWTPMDGRGVWAVITANDDGASAAFVGSSSCQTGSYAPGMCQVTINSATPGSTTIEARWGGGTVAGATIGARNTDPDADKDWVAVRITISPPFGVNPINTDHILTITLEKSVVDGLWTPLAGETVTATRSNSGGATATFVGPSSGLTNASGQFNVTINSSTAGSTIVWADWAGGTVDGAVITFKTTDPDADKDWIEACIDIEKSTNGYDADYPPGPAIPVGDTVNWVYMVDNCGTEPLSNINVTDDNGTPGNLGDDFSPAYVSGDDGDWILQTNETWIYQWSGTAVAGQYGNIATVTGEPPDAPDVSDFDPSHYRTPAEVGGTVLPVNKFRLLAPWAVLLGCAGVVTLLMLRKRRQA